MPKKKIEHGSRIPIRRKHGNWQPLTKTHWFHIEKKILAQPLSDKAKERIEYYCRFFAFSAPMYASENTVLQTKLEAALSKWRSSTNELLTLLGSKIPKPPDFEEFAGEAAKFTLKDRLNTLFPLDMIDPLLRLSSQGASFISEQMQMMRYTTVADLWDVWVTLVAKTLEQEGIKPTAQATSNSENNSPFVNLIKYLQANMPEAEQTKREDGAIVKGIQSARKIHGKLSEEALSFQLVILASQNYIPTSIGSLRQKSPQEVAKLEAWFREEIQMMIEGMAQAMMDPEIREMLSTSEATPEIKKLLEGN